MNYGYVMPNKIDTTYLIAVLTVPLIVQLFTLPRLKADLAAGLSFARIRSFRRALVVQWSVALPILFIWRWYGRPWSSLFVTIPTSGVHLYAAITLTALTICFGLTQVGGIRRIAARPEARAKHAMRLKAGGVNLVIPRTVGEFQWLVALSLTAGICEELLW